MLDVLNDKKYSEETKQASEPDTGVVELTDTTGKKSKITTRNMSEEKWQACRQMRAPGEKQRK